MMVDDRYMPNNTGQSWMNGKTEGRTTTNNKTDDNNNDDSCRDNGHNKEIMILSSAASITCYQYRHAHLFQACSFPKQVL